MLKNLQLSTRLGLIFTLILTLTLGTAFFGWFGQRQAVDRTAKIMNIEDFIKTLYQTRLQEKDFVIHNNEMSVKNFQILLKSLMNQTSQLKTLLKSDAHQEQLEKIIADVKEYDKNFVNYHGFTEQKRIAAQEMNKVAEDVLQKSFFIDSTQRDLLKENIDEIERTINVKLVSENYIDQLVRLFMEARILQTNLLYEYDARQALSVDSLGQQLLNIIKKLRAGLQITQNIDKLDTIRQLYETYQQQYKNHIDKKNNAQIKTKQPEDEEALQNIEFSVSEIIRNLQSLRNEQFADLKESVSTTNVLADERLEKVYDTNQIVYFYLLARQQEALFFRNGDQHYLIQVVFYLGKALNITNKLLEKLKTQKNIDLLQDLINSIKNYVVELDKYATLEIQQHQLDKQMDERAYQTVKEIQKILLNQERAITIEMENTLSIILFFVIVSILIGVLSATWITRLITTSLNDNIKLMEKIAAGDLRRNITVENNDELGKLRRALNEMQAHLYQVVKQVRETTNRLFEMANEVSFTAKALSDGATQQAAGVEEISAAMEEMTSAIEQNADNARHTSKIASASSMRADEGGKAVNDTVNSMQQIASKVRVVEEVAYKTNLLALNAAIEAARAGEHGSGFAVVAEEVRTLAEHTQISAREILNLVANSLQVADKAGKLLKEIVPSAQNTAALIEGITYSSDEQAAGIKQINVTMVNLDHVTQHNAAASETLAVTAETMNHEAERLQQLMLFFKLQDNDTLETFEHLDNEDAPLHS